MMNSDTIVSKIGVWFFKRWRYTLLLWLTLLLAGGVVYTSQIKREGFPPVQFPLTVVTGTYFVDDVAKVDTTVVKPVSELLSNEPNIETSRLTAGASFFTITAQFSGDTKPEEGTVILKSLIEKASLPPEVALSYTTIDPASFLNKYDMLLSLYSTSDSTTAAELQDVAGMISDEINSESFVTLTEPQDLVTIGVNPQTGQEESRQTAFSRIGLSSEQGQLTFYPAITIGIDRARDEVDIIQLSEKMTEKLSSLDMAKYGDEYRLVIGADFADSIQSQISSLESNLLSGLIAVAIVSFLLISWRASLITGLFMVTVMATVILVLYLVGYTLNTITLFALVLSLGLFVDDATIVVESLDASRRSKKKKSAIVRSSLAQVGAASFAGTMTTVLVFLPLAFISGVLGEFIRLMPVTVIIALVSSFLLSITLIPLLAKFVLFRDSKTDWFTRINPVTKVESFTAKKLGSLTMLLKTQRKRGVAIGVLSVFISFLFIGSAGFFAQKLSFNVFPASKDSDQVGYTVTYPAGYTLPQAEAVVDTINATLSDNFGAVTQRVTYGSFNQPNERSADALIELTPFTERDRKSPQIIEDLEAAVSDVVDDAISVRFVQFDAGPPAEEFPFKMQIYTEDEQKAMSFAGEVGAVLEGATVTRANNTTAQVTEVKLPAEDTVSRKDGRRVFEVQASFDATDTSALVIAAKSLVSEAFSEDELRERGFEPNDIGYDFGQESENEESFSSLGIIFPLALLLMYILLALQFRSFLQPLLIFMAIPFSLFGVFAGLYFTDNALSFFAMVGLIGLIGIAVNNAILLTDYANQERRDGADPVTAISDAVVKRFRPLVTTTVTTIVALLPLALSDPFWEALAFTIIFGLLSSTFLVVVAFPYYYLMAEALRTFPRRIYSRVKPRKK
jgi:multidrug efflux pump subunit AcrB